MAKTFISSPRELIIFLSRLTAALIVIMLFSGHAQAAGIRSVGIPDWLAPAAERSMSAVLDHIPEGENDETKRQLLSVVASRLLRGYTVASIAFAPSQDGAEIRFEAAPDATSPIWQVRVVPPQLSSPVLEWFASDAEGLDARVVSLLDGVPVEALSWSGDELKRAVDEICSDDLPGWRSSLMVRGEADASGATSYTMEISFAPEGPLAIAVSSKISSSSIPVMFHSNLKDLLLRGWSPIIGTPVLWLRRHSGDIAAETAELIKDDPYMRFSRARADVTVEADSISELDIDIESRRYSAWVWMAVYSGADGRSPEAGLHFGRWATIMHDVELELFGELIFPMDDWSMEGRFGVGWSPYRDLWLAGEWSSRDDMWWARLRVDSRTRRRPYLWGRFSEHGDINAAFGVRVTDQLSIEIHYDSRDEDMWNLRAIVNM